MLLLLCGRPGGGERGDQYRCPVREVGDALDAAGAQRQHRRRRSPAPNLRLLVAMQPDGMIGRIEVEPDDVPHLADKRRVCGQLRAFRPGFTIEPARSPLELLILPVTDGRSVTPSRRARSTCPAAPSAGARTSCARRARLCVEWTRLMRPTRRTPPSLSGSVRSRGRPIPAIIRCSLRTNRPPALAVT